MGDYQFFAMMSRMKLITRWALMRNTKEENISEHSLEVAMLAHALAVIGKKRLGKQLNAERIALLGMYHDSTEIITGDMPTPIKYYNKEMQSAFKDIESTAAIRLLNMLPEDLREEYSVILSPKGTNEQEIYEQRLVKAADKLSAFIKCIEEEKTGNNEFIKAKQATEAALDGMELEEVQIFKKEFLAAYSKTLDELQ